MRQLVFFILFLLCSLKQVQAQPSSALVAEAGSGYLLIKNNPQEEIPPASLTKVMTLYLTFGALEKGWLKWEDKLPISEHAANQPRTKLNLQAGQTISVKEAVLALIIHSANDAAVVLAESMASNEKEFADLMTQTAAFLNMKKTTFKNASGLHEEGQKTTAQDMAILTLAIINHFPKYYPLFTTPSFDFNGRTYTSHNRILNEYEGAEGLKTGYVAAAGYNIISTAQKDNVRLIGILMGKESAQERDAEMRQLLDKGFQKVAFQKKAVKSGRLNPVFDPLHRRALLKKVDMNLFAHSIKSRIKKMRRMVSLLKPQRPKVDMDSALLDKWTIQIGAFGSLKKAEEVSKSAFTLLGLEHIKPLTEKNASLYRARLTGFTTKKYADEACKVLSSQSYPCFLLPPTEAQGDK
ncbi:MAG: D-alanyl-D-alanine carboxypeptidase [Alphaproteobacteria bacterium]|nr:D-alanyl-D-alanine carboxypeptidase [Alphaproteobacteria bacterium]